MPRWAVVVLSVAAGLAVIVALGAVLVRGGEETIETGPTVAVTTTEEATTTTAPPEIPTLRVTVRGGEPVGGIQRLTVSQGERVRVSVRSDVSDHVHLHGYDLMRDVAPGSPATIQFRATLPGVFEIELEDGGTPIAELEVRP